MTIPTQTILCTTLPDSSMEVTDKPPTSKFQFDTEKVKTDDNILVDLKRKGILFTIDETDSVLNTEVEIKLQLLTGGRPRLAERLTFV